jgi:hypothetical protein
MSITGQSGTGQIVLFDDFCGPEIPILGTVAINHASGGFFTIGDFKVTGDVVNNDSGVVQLEKASGYIRIIGSAQTDGDGIAVGTDLCFSPLLNGTLVLEARVEMNELTTKNVFVGFCTANADIVLEPFTSVTETLTTTGSVASVGFHFDSTLTVDATAATAVWHMPYLLATDSTQSSLVIASSQVAVAGESDVLRLEIDPNGAARWYINGKLEQSVGAGLAATPATLVSGMVGVWAKSTAVGIDIDYLLIKANRDWTR